METLRKMRLASFFGGLLVLCVAFITLLVFTQNMLITLIAFQTVIYSYATEIALLYMLDIQFGAIEVLTAGLIVCLSAS